MLRVHPVSLNTVSYNAVIRALESIRDGKQGIVDQAAADDGKLVSNTVTLREDPPIINDVFIDTVGDPEFYKSKLTQALGT